MERPYLTESQRQLIYLDTSSGALLMLNLKIRILCRDIYSTLIKPIFK